MIISRKEAIEQNLKYYFNGIPCPKGHLCNRTTQKSTCVKCTNLAAGKRQKERRKENPESTRIKDKQYRAGRQHYFKTYNAEWTAKNPTYFATYRKENKGAINAKTAKRRATKLNATPKWVDKEALKVFYKNCPDGYVVDHVIPLIHKEVCGLHVPCNLQYLTPTENSAKGNNFNPLS